MADLIERNSLRKIICAACSERLQCTDMGNVCFEVSCINNAPKVDAEPVRRWIPCGERMPEGGEEVLCYSLDWGAVVTCVDKFDLIRVTHWMPLPEPPKEE